MKIYEGNILTCDAQDHVYRFLIEEDGRIVYGGNELPEKYEDKERILKVSFTAFGITTIIDFKQLTFNIIRYIINTS